jgi:hypothetical protein
MGLFTDITGQRYGKLVALHPTNKRTKSGGYVWHFKCDCGKEKDVPANSVKSKLVKSCGCEYRIHGSAESRLFTIWVNMKQRCENPNVPHYKLYGGKGVYICEEWHDFVKFQEWSLNNGYSDSLTIDRIDSNKGYTPENCRWTTNKEQQRNKSNNHLVTYNGETHCIAEWSEILGMSRMAILLRLNRYGFTAEEALTKPLRKTGAVCRRK